MGNNSSQQVYQGKIQEDYIAVTQTAHNGVPAYPSCLAYDSVRNLCAVGNQRDGLIKVFGLPGLELFLRSTAATGTGRVRFLHFLANGNLLAVYQHEIELWNVDQRTSIQQWRFQHTVESICTSPLSCIVHVGDARGVVHVLNAEKIRLSTYTISCNDCGLSKESSVIALHLKPSNEEALLIGYENGTIVEWDLRNRKVIMIYLYANPDTVLTSLAWSRSGSYFISGYVSGDIVVWKCGTNYPQKSLRISPTMECQPIKKIVYTATHAKGDVLWYVLGGTDPAEPPFISLLRLSPEGIISEQKNLKWKEMGIVDFAVGFASPWPTEEFDPKAIVAISDNGRLGCYSLTGTLAKSLRVPPPFIHQDKSITCLKVIKSSPAFLQDLRAISNTPPQWVSSKVPWPISGGVLAKKTVPDAAPILLVTVHTNSKIRIWEYSQRQLVLILHLQVEPHHGIIQHFELCPESRRIFLATDQGVLLAYSFFMDMAEEKIWFYDPQGLRKEAEMQTPMVSDDGYDVASKQGTPTVDDASDFVIIEDSPNAPNTVSPSHSPANASTSNAIPSAASNPRIGSTSVSSSTSKSTTPLSTSSAEIKQQQSPLPQQPSPPQQLLAVQAESKQAPLKRERSRSTNPFDVENLPANMNPSPTAGKQASNNSPREATNATNQTASNSAASNNPFDNQAATTNASHNPFDAILATQQQQGGNASPNEANNTNAGANNNAAQTKDQQQQHIADPLSPPQSPAKAGASNQPPHHHNAGNAHVKMLSPKIRYPGFQVTMHICWPAPIVGMFLESSKNRLRISDAEGRLVSFDISLNPSLMLSKEVLDRDYVTQVHPLPAILARHLVSKDSHVHTRATHSHPNMRRDGSGSNAASLSGSLDQGQAKDDLVLMLVTAKGHVLLLDTSLGVVTNPLKDTEKDREKERLQRRALAGEIMASSVGLPGQMQHVNLNSHVIVFADLVNERGRNVLSVRRETTTHDNASTPVKVQKSSEKLTPTQPYTPPSPTQAPSKPTFETANKENSEKLFFLVVEQHAIFVYELPSFHVVNSITFSFTIVWATILTLVNPTMVSDNAVMVIEKSGKMSFYSLMDLRPILETKSFDLSHFMSCFDEHTLKLTTLQRQEWILTLVSKANEIVQLKLSPDYLFSSTPSLNTSTGMPADSVTSHLIVPIDQSTLPPRPKFDEPSSGGFLSSMFGGGSSQKSPLIEVYHFSENKYDDVASAFASMPRDHVSHGHTSSTGKLATNNATPSTPTKQATNTNANATPSKATSFGASAQKSGQTGATNTASSTQRVQMGNDVKETKQIMQQNVNQIMERGDMISKMQQQTEELANHSASFAEKAKRLRQNQQKSIFDF